MLVWLLQQGLVEQIHPYVYLLRPLPPPLATAAAGPTTATPPATGTATAKVATASGSAARDADSDSDGEAVEEDVGLKVSPFKERAARSATGERLALHFRAVAQHLLSAGLAADATGGPGSGGGGGSSSGDVGGSGFGGYGGSGSAAGPVRGALKPRRRGGGSISCSSPLALCAGLSSFFQIHHSVV
jgi:uncharacterized membrane protein YgcG